LDLEICPYFNYEELSLYFVDFSKVQLGMQNESDQVGFTADITDNYAILDSGTSFSYIPTSVIG